MYHRTSQPHRCATNGGYSFVEVLVAITILLVAIVGPLTIASTGLKNAMLAREQSTAYFLAQEGIEAVQHYRDERGLEHMLNSAVETWDWITYDVPSECVDSGTPCRVDVINHTMSACDPVSECDLYLHETGDARYTYDSSGAATPFRRLVYINTVAEGVAQVRSVVEWDTNTFGSTRNVELSSYFYDIYAQGISSGTAE